jgi:hypothetical protein
MTDKDGAGNYEVAFYEIAGGDDPTTAPEPTTPVSDLADGYYLVGTMTEWKAESAYKFSENASNPGEYMLNTTLASGDGVKAVKVENGAITTWYPDGTDNDYDVDAAHAGNATIYFQPEYKADWAEFGGYMWVEMQVINPTTEEPTTVEPTDPVVIVILGDVTGDGMVDINDALAIQKYDLGVIPEGFIEAAGDVDGNGIVDGNDALEIQKYDLTGTSKYPIGEPVSVA